MITIYTLELDFNLFSAQKTKEEKKFTCWAKCHYRAPSTLVIAILKDLEVFAVKQWQVPIKYISEEKNERQGLVLPASTLPTKTQANNSFISPDIIQIDASVVSEWATEHRVEKSGSYIMTIPRKTILDFSHDRWKQYACVTKYQSHAFPF